MLPNPLENWSDPVFQRVPRETPGSVQPFYFAAGVELAFMLFVPFFLCVFFLCFMVLVPDVGPGVAGAAKIGPDTATRNNTATIEANHFFITFSFFYFKIYGRGSRPLGRRTGPLSGLLFPTPGWGRERINRPAFGGRARARCCNRALYREVRNSEIIERQGLPGFGMGHILRRRHGHSLRVVYFFHG